MPILTLNLHVTYVHSFGCCILCMPQSFYKHIILEGLMIQQWKPIRNKQIHCYIVKLLPWGIT